MPKINPHKLRARRKSKGLAQADLYKSLGEGWSQSRVSNLENPRLPYRKDVTDDELAVLAKIIGCPIEALTVNDDDIESNPADVELFRKAEKVIEYAKKALNMELTEDQRLEAVLNLYHFNTVDNDSAILLLRGFGLK